MGSTKQVNTQDLADALQRDAQLKKTRAELLRAIFNRAGLERLRAVTDADWREAESPQGGLRGADADSNQG